MNGQTEWNRFRQWKRIKEVWLATWDVHTLYRAGAMNELLKEMDKYKADLCALQEIRWPGGGTATKKICVILHTGHKSDKHESGTGFYISSHIMDFFFYNSSL